MCKYEDGELRKCTMHDSFETGRGTGICKVAEEEKELDFDDDYCVWE